MRSSSWPNLLFGLPCLDGRTRASNQHVARPAPWRTYSYTKLLFSGIVHAGAVHAGRETLKPQVPTVQADSAPPRT